MTSAVYSERGVDTRKRSRVGSIHIWPGTRVHECMCVCVCDCRRVAGMDPIIESTNGGHRPSSGWQRNGARMRVRTTEKK